MTLFHELFPEQDSHELMPQAVVYHDKWVGSLAWKLERGNSVALAFNELELVLCQHFFQGALRDYVSNPLNAPFLEVGNLIVRLRRNFRPSALPHYLRSTR